MVDLVADPANPIAVHREVCIKVLDKKNTNTNTNIFILHRFLKQITLADSQWMIVIYNI